MSLKTFTAPTRDDTLGLLLISNNDGTGFTLSDPGVYTLRASLPWYHSTTDMQAIGSMTAVDAGEEVQITVTDTPVTWYTKTEHVGDLVPLTFKFITAAGGAPSGGTDGQVLMKVSGAAQWSDLPAGVPTPPTEGRYALQAAGGELVWDVDNTIFTFNQLGAGYGLYNGKTNGVGQLRTIKAGSGCTLSVDGDGSLLISVP